MLSTNQPRCARLAAWGTAVLRGRVAVDQALDVLVGTDDTVEVWGLPEAAGVQSLALAFGQLRLLGITGLVYVPAFPGDVMGLPGPPSFNATAVASGGAVIAADGEPVALLATVERHGTDDDHATSVRWHAHAVARCASGPAFSLAEAERQLLDAVNESVDELSRLDVAQWRDEANDLVLAWEADAPTDLPPGLPERAERLIVRSERMSLALDLAIDDDGNAISSSEAVRRRDTLVRLQRHVNLAAVTAWNIGLAPTGPVP